MVNKLDTVTIASLLHDIGKLNYKAGGERKTHSRLGADFYLLFVRIQKLGRRFCAVSVITMQSI